MRTRPAIETRALSPQRFQGSANVVLADASCTALHVEFLFAAPPARIGLPRSAQQLLRLRVQVVLAFLRVPTRSRRASGARPRKK
jgi:hypothetical protein